MNEVSIVRQNGSFDSIVLVSVLEHLANPAQVIEDCVSLLKPGGTLSLTVPDSSRFRLITMLRRAFRMEPWTYFHISFFSKRNLDRLFDHVGLRVEQVSEEPLITPESVEYFKRLYNSSLVAWGMKSAVKLRMDRAFGIQTLNYYITEALSVYKMTLVGC